MKNERKKGWERKNHYFIQPVIILGAKYVWSSYSNCYRALQYKRATAANLKKKRDGETVGAWFFCVCSPNKALARETIGDTLIYLLLFGGGN